MRLSELRCYPGEGSPASCPRCGHVGLRTRVYVRVFPDGHESVDLVETWCPECGWGR